MESFTYYVKKGDNNRVADQPATANADGLVAVTLADYEKEYFLQYWNQYYWDANGDFQSPEDLPSHSTAMLRLTVANQADLISEQDKTIASQDTDITALKAAKKELESANNLTQQGLMEAVDYLSAQVAKTTATATTTDTTTGEAK